MSPSVKKRPEYRVISQMLEKESQDVMQKPITAAIEWSRLKTLQKSLALLRLRKSLNSRAQKVNSLATRCWHSMVRAPMTVWIPYRNGVFMKVKLNNGRLQEARHPKRKRGLKGEPEKRKSAESGPKGLKCKRRLEERSKAKQSAAPVTQEEEPEVPGTSRDCGLTTGPGDQESQLFPGSPRIIFLKVHRNLKWDTKEPDEIDQWIWFEGLPTRIHLPGPRVMCRSSARRWVKRCCTRFCSASLELPMCPLYRV